MCPGRVTSVLFRRLVGRSDLDIDLRRVLRLHAFRQKQYDLRRDDFPFFFDLAARERERRSHVDVRHQLRRLQRAERLVKAEDFDPRDATIMVSGHPLYLDQIEYMVEDLTKAHGDPGNELGLLVNLMYIFKTLGFDWVDNTGNLMHITRHNEAVLTLELECNPNVDEALVEAFQKAYPKLTVEVVD